MEVESLCTVVVSSDDLYSTGLSSLVIPGETCTNSLNTLFGELPVTPWASVVSAIYWWLGVHYVALDTFSHEYCMPFALTRTLLPFFWTTVKGDYGVDSLFSFSCLNNTLSPFWISLSCAFLLQFAHTFPFSFLSFSLSLTSSSSLNSCSWGSLVLMHLPNNISVGLTPVVVWGVLQYIIKKLSISHLQLRPFAWAICRHFRILRFCLSISHLLVAIRVWFASVQFHSLLSTFWNSHWQTVTHC